MANQPPRPMMPPTAMTVMSDVNNTGPTMRALHVNLPLLLGPVVLGVVVRSRRLSEVKEGDRDADDQDGQGDTAEHQSPVVGAGAIILVGKQRTVAKFSLGLGEHPFSLGHFGQVRGDLFLLGDLVHAMRLEDLAGLRVESAGDADHGPGLHLATALRAAAGAGGRRRPLTCRAAPGGRDLDDLRALGAFDALARQIVRRLQILTTLTLDGDRHRGTSRGATRTLADADVEAQGLPRRGPLYSERRQLNRQRPGRGRGWRIGGRG